MWGRSSHVHCTAAPTGEAILHIHHTLVANESGESLVVNARCDAGNVSVDASSWLSGHCLSTGNDSARAQPSTFVVHQTAFTRQATDQMIMTTMSTWCHSYTKVLAWPQQKHTKRRCSEHASSPTPNTEHWSVAVHCRPTNRPNATARQYARQL